MSILDRFKIWKRRRETPVTDPEAVPEKATTAVPEPCPALPAPIPADPVAPVPPVDPSFQREEAIQKIREGFEDLSRHLASLGTNVRNQAEASQGIREKMDALPQLLEESRRGNRTGEELLGLLNQEASEAGLRQRESLQILRVLPVALAAIQENEIATYKVLAGIGKDLAKRAESDREMAAAFQRMDATLAQFHEAARIQTEQLQAQGRIQKGIAVSFLKTQNRTVEAFEQAQERSVDELRDGQSEAIHAFAQSQDRMRRGFLWVAGGAAAVVGIVLVLVFAVWARAVGDLDRGFRTVEKRTEAVDENAGNLLKEREKEARRLRQALEARETKSAGTAPRDAAPPSGAPVR
jgi:hypothetical protein